MSITRAMTPLPITCRDDDSLAAAARLMESYGIGFMPVLAADGRLRGVITDRDIVCRGIAMGREPETTLVSACMSSPAITMAHDDGIQTCLGLMQERRIRRVLVVDEHGACCGVVSQDDLSTIASDRAFAALARELGHVAAHAGGGSYADA